MAWGRRTDTVLILAGIGPAIAQFNVAAHGGVGVLGPGEVGDAFGAVGGHAAHRAEHGDDGKVCRLAGHQQELLQLAGLWAVSGREGHHPAQGAEDEAWAAPATREQVRHGHAGQQAVARAARFGHVQPAVLVSQGLVLKRRRLEAKLALREGEMGVDEELLARLGEPRHYRDGCRRGVVPGVVVVILLGGIGSRRFQNHFLLNVAVVVVVVVVAVVVVVMVDGGMQIRCENWGGMRMIDVTRAFVE